MSIIFEFVLLVKKDGKVSEISSGWAQALLSEFNDKKEKFTLDIIGGSPISKQNIQQNDIRTKRSGWGKVASLFSGKVVSQLIFEVKTHKQLNDQDKVRISSKF